MKSANCFYDDLKELMRLHNIKNLDLTVNIENGKLLVNKITVIDQNNDVVITTEKEY